MKKSIWKMFSVMTTTAVLLSAAPINIWAAEETENYEEEEYSAETDTTDENWDFPDGEGYEMDDSDEDVETSEQDITELIFDKSELSLVMTKTKKITFTTNLSEEVDGAEFNWSSSDEDVAEVDDEGFVTGLAPGVTTISAENEYGAAAELEVKVSPQGTAFKKVVGGKKQMGVKWVMQKVKADITGYQLEYAASKNMSGSSKVLVKGRTTSSWVIKNLKGGKTYYVRVRTYKQVGKLRYFSSWSKIKSAKIK